MKRGLGLDNDQLHHIFDRWNRQELESFLVEITADIFSTIDERTGGHVVDVILDVARQKGTGLWTAKEAMDLRVPAPTIDMAVGMRIMSELKSERERAGGLLSGPGEGAGAGPEGSQGPGWPEGSRPESRAESGAGDLVEKLRNGLYAAFIVTYAQGMALLRRASDEHGYDLDLEAVARIWRGGCIIRSALLEDIRAAYQEQPGLSNLLLNDRLAEKVMSRQQDWREVIQAAARWGIPAPGLMVSLAYYDGFRSARLPANLIQAQRDYFGAHTYERIDRAGTFHTAWLREE
jgi:6-phosphogluconate dehydrogenase